MRRKQDPFILVGTYRKECKAWIQKRLLYNYPITERSEEFPFSLESVSHISLYNRNTKALHYKAAYKRHVSLEDLRKLEYPVCQNPHATKYALFSLMLIDGPKSAESEAVAKAEKKYSHLLSYNHPVIARVEDFAETDDDKAILSHWLHNKGSSSAGFYNKRAKELLPRNLFELLSRTDLRVGEGTQSRFLFPELFQVPFPPPENPKFTFIDLFAGIGGIRLGFQAAGGKCVFSSEWDANAAKTYAANFGEQPFGDITKIPASVIPDFDVLLAGFPCQPFSIIGDKEGFGHETQGTLFFNIEKILMAKRPKAFMLENVRNLTAHDHGRTFRVILEHLRTAGYDVHYKVLNALDYGVPQNRERIIICGFRRPTRFEFPPPIPVNARKQAKDILDDAAEMDLSLFVKPGIRDSRLRRMKAVDFPKPYISHENIAGAITPHTYSCALRAGASANYILINNMRRPSAREMLRIQGFPDEFRIVVNYGQIKRQTGNSVAVPMIKAVARRIVDAMFECEGFGTANQDVEVCHA
jgi:DNA (cytosine-5)-methyltransferase 1